MQGGQVLRSIEYEYDAADRLVEERITDPVLGNRTISDTYDPVGNRMTKTNNGVVTEYTYDNNDRLLTESGFSYTHDDNGNLLTKIGNGGNWQLEYNALNQLTRANISTPQRGSVIDYAYDHDGIRIGKTINGTEITNYVVDKNRPYAQVLEEQRTRSGLSATTNYVYGDALISAATEESTHYYHTDGLGSVRGLSDASGALTDRYTYDAYGLLTSSSGATVNPYRYRGEQYDADLNAYYLRARYYHPGTGRFLTTDPVEGVVNDPITQHRYVYGNNDPINYIDPSGKFGLMDLTATTLILNCLSTIAADNVKAVGNVYAFLGENVFADAVILGASGTVPINILKLWSDIFGVSIPSHIQGALNIFYVKGYELLFSVSSGEIALFKVSGKGFEGGSMQYQGFPFYRPPRIDVGVSIYEGQVYNLWNADNYSGDFHSAGVNYGNSGLSLFCSPKEMLMGPWGVGRTIWSKNLWRRKNLTVFGSSTYYDSVDNLPFLSEGGVITNIMLISYFLNGLSDYHNFINVGQLLMDVTAWWQIGIAKSRWNKNAEHDVTMRQNLSREKYNAQYNREFQSGPSLFVFGR